jgi:hypothetical protein
VKIESLEDRGVYNRNIFIQILKDNDYDTDYLLTWGLPDFWKESLWGYSECVLELFYYFEKHFGICDSSESYLDIDTE